MKITFPCPFCDRTKPPFWGNLIPEIEAFKGVYFAEPLVTHYYCDRCGIVYDKEVTERRQKEKLQKEKDEK